MDRTTWMRFLPPLKQAEEELPPLKQAEETGIQEEAEIPPLVGDRKEEKEEKEEKEREREE
jgi:hypothetical protein